MFYSMYLQSVCTRRQWPDPLYEPHQSGSNHYCKVRVNNREYSTDVPYKSESLAREGAAMNAYMICRNFSHNDGMCPGQRPGHRSANGVAQGLPVAIGTGRRGPNRCSRGSSFDECASPPLSEEDGDGGSSGGGSPRSLEGGFDMQVAPQMPGAVGGAGKRGAGKGSEGFVLCFCRRGSVRAYGRCGVCLRECGWA